MCPRQDIYIFLTYEAGEKFETQHWECLGDGEFFVVYGTIMFKVKIILSDASNLIVDLGNKSNRPSTPLGDWCLILSGSSGDHLHGEAFSQA